MIFEKCVDTRIYTFDAQTFAHKDTNTHHFGCHGQTNAQRHCDVFDCDPFVLVHAFDNNSAAAATVVLGAAIPEGSHRFPSFSITLLVNNNVPLSFCPQVRQMISFLVMFSEDMFNELVDV